MFSTIVIIVLLLIIWFLSGVAYMFLSMYTSEKSPATEAFFMFPVNLVAKIAKYFEKIAKKFGKR